MAVADAEATAARAPSLAAFVGYFLRLGTFGFGGPIALAGYMQRDLVEERGWVTKDEYVKGLALAQLAPGPLAAQLAIYLGWARGGILGATLVAHRVRAAVVPDGHGDLRGLRPLRRSGLDAVGVLRHRRGGDRDHSPQRVQARAADARPRSAAVGDLRRERDRDRGPGGGGRLAHSRLRRRDARRADRGESRATVPLAIVPPIALAAAGGASAAGGTTLFWFFAKAGAFVFGSGLAIVPFLYGGVVREHGWLTDQQFLDAVAVAMITPGPVVITVAFIGYLVQGFGGAVLASLGVFLPCYLFVVIPAPFYARFADNPRLKAFVDGVTAAATGAIAGAVYVLARRAIIDIPTILIFAATLACLVWLKRVPEPVVIAVVGIASILVGGL